MAKHHSLIFICYCILYFFYSCSVIGIDIWNYHLDIKIVTSRISMNQIVAIMSFYHSEINSNTNINFTPGTIGQAPGIQRINLYDQIIIWSENQSSSFSCGFVFVVAYSRKRKKSSQIHSAIHRKITIIDENRQWNEMLI